MSYLLKLGRVIFPKPKDININMLPFIIGKKESIPPEFRHYYPLIEQCQVKLNPSQDGKVGYLSISESMVKKGTTQRRPGIHTDRQGKGIGWGWGRGDIAEGIDWGRGRIEDMDWGRGRIEEENAAVDGGIFVASNVDDSFRAWNMCIDEPGRLGSCDHLADTLKNEIVAKKDQLWWMADTCPHESLPLKEDTYRQWFRFITKDLSIWYDHHSTSNRLGVKPDCKVVYGSKFA